MYTDSGDAQPAAGPWTVITADGPQLYVADATRTHGLILMIDADPGDPLASCAAVELIAAEVATLIAALHAATPAREEVKPL